MEKENLVIEIIVEHEGTQKGTLAWFKEAIVSGDITFHDYIQEEQQILRMDIVNAGGFTNEHTIARGCTSSNFGVDYEAIWYTTKVTDDVIKEIAQKWCDLRNHEVSPEEVPNLEINIVEVD